MTRQGLSYKVAAGAGALALAVLLLAAAAAYTVLATQLRDHARQRLDAEAQLRAVRTAAMMYDLVTAMRVHADGAAQSRAFPHGLSEMLDLHGVEVHLAIADARGFVQRNGGSDPLAVAAIAAGRPVSRIVDGIGGGPDLVLAHPVIAAGSGTPVGALVGRLHLAELGRRASTPSAVVRSVVLLCHTDDGQYEIAAGVPVDTAAMDALVPLEVPPLLENHRFVLRAVAPPDLVSGPVNRLGVAVAVSGLMVAAVVVALAMLLGERLAAPLSRLASEVAALPQPGEDETAVLGRVLAEMSGQLDNARRDIERRGQTLLFNAERLAHIGSSIWDFAANQHQWSDEFHAVLGLEPGDCRPSLEVFLDRVHPADRPRVLARIEAAVRGGGTIVEDFRVIRPDGEVRVLHGQGEVVGGDDGKPVRMNSTIQDITERKRLEERLDALVRELSRSNEELEEFAYVCSHDLRQPLRAVGSYVSLLEEDLATHLSGETREFITFAREGVRRMDRLITDLLTYSRVGRTAKDGPVEVDEALRGAIADLQMEIDETGASLVVPPRLPVVMGDRGEMARLFQNLLGNALKYRRPDVLPMVEVTCEAVGTEWWFAVIDNGIGIPPEHSERIFGIFQRLHARDEYEGTGVGLAICRKIVERHSGRIWADTTVESGTVIRFTWPKG